MTSANPPNILILDDDPIQHDSVELQLDGLGHFLHYADPRDAIAFLRKTQVDAIVADIRMPALPVDGLWFLEQLRSFDPVTAVVIRTGDEHLQIAEAAIDAHATQRVIKLQPGATAKLRAAVTKGITETREQRQLLAAAATAEETKHKLVHTLARIDQDLTTTAIVRALVTEISNHAIALSGYAQTLADPLRRHPQLGPIVMKNLLEATHLSEKIEAFLSNPFVDPRFAGSISTSINHVLSTLDRYFHEHPLFLERNHRLTSRGILPDQFFIANPPKLLSAIRHLIEYAALRSSAGSSLALTVTTTPSTALALAAAKGAFTLYARQPSNQLAADLTLRAHCDFTSLPLATDISRSSDDPRIGNLLVLAGMLLDEPIAFAALPAAPQLTDFHFYIPLSL